MGTIKRVETKIYAVANLKADSQIVVMVSIFTRYRDTRDNKVLSQARAGLGPSDVVFQNCFLQPTRRGGVRCSTTAHPSSSCMPFPGFSYAGSPRTSLLLLCKVIAVSYRTVTCVLIADNICGCGTGEGASNI